MQTDADDDLWVIEDARASECFVGLYRQGEALLPDRCLTVAELAQLPPGSYLGNPPPGSLTGWQQLPPKRTRAEALALLLDLRLARLDAAEVASLPRRQLPLYLNLSQAERSAMRYG